MDDLSVHNLYGNIHEYSQSSIAKLPLKALAAIIPRNIHKKILGNSLMFVKLGT